MNVFNKVTLQTLKKNKARTLVTIIGVILSVAMICAVTTLVSSVQNFLLECAIHDNGDWHGSFRNITWQDCKKVTESDELSDSTFGQHLGYAKVDSQVDQRPFLRVIGGEKDSFFNTLPVRLTSGRLPKSSNEIILPNNLASEGGVKHKIGDTIALNLGEPTYDDETDAATVKVRETRTFTVVGFYEAHRNIEDRQGHSYTALTVADAKQTDGAVYDMYFKMRKASGVYDFLNNFGFESSSNTDVLLLSGVSKYHSVKTTLVALAAVVTALIMLGSIALIYNAFSISVSERTKQFGLLSSIGATKKQIRKMVLFEALAVSAVGIPLGIGTGIAGIGVTLKLLGNKFAALAGGMGDHPMRLCVSWGAVVIAVVVGLFTVLLSAWIPSKRATKVSAIEAIRQTADIKAENTQVKISKLTYKLFGLPGVLANKHYKRNKRKYRATVISLVMSIVLFVSASAFSTYLTKTTDAALSTVGYDVSAYVPGDELNKITAEELLSKVKAGKSVTKAAYYVCANGMTSTKPEYLTETGKNSFAGGEAETSVIFVDDTAFKALLKELGLSEKTFMNPDSPRGIIVDGTTEFNYNTQKYETVTRFKAKEPQFVMNRERSIPGYYFANVATDENGNKVLRYLKNEDSSVEGPEELYLSPEEGYIHTPLHAGAVIHEKPYFVQNSDNIKMIYPISAAKKVFDDFDASEHSYNYMLCSDNPAASYDSVKTIWDDNGFNHQNVKNKAKDEEFNRNLITIVQVFSYGFIAMISLIAAANVFNTISTNISLRRREFAMLKSVGMSQKGFNRMMNFECLLYGSKALLYGLPVSAGVTYLIYKAVSNGFETSFHLPWTATGIAVLSVFLVVFVTMMYSMSKVKKDNPIDALKNENL